MGLAILVFQEDEDMTRLPTFNIPPIGSRQGKVWGITQLLFAFNGIECHRIHAIKGGYCSKHSHKHKWNRFIVLSGQLVVRLFHGLGKIDETILASGHVTDVPPGVLHQFEALEDTEALEIYWTVLEADDIDRESEGGVRLEVT